VTTRAIRAVDTRLVRIPLARPWGPDVRDIRVVQVTVTDDAGEQSVGFSWTPSIGGSAVQALIDTDLAPFAIGRPAEPTWWDDAWLHLHEAGGGGITTIAIAGLDLALWDLQARRRGLPVADLLDRRHSQLTAYGSGVNLHYTLDELTQQAKRWVDAGFDAVKVKVGKPDIAEDVDRIRTVRETIGPGRALMLDANQRWSLDTAVSAVEALSPFGIEWFEEPLIAEDLRGHAELKRRTGATIAVGENLHTESRFAEFIDAGAADVFQPNVIRVGGITPARRIADRVQSAGARLAFHLLPELSSQLAFAVEQPTWVEIVEDAGFAELGALTSPTGLVVHDGVVSGGPLLGLGFRFR